MLEEIKNQFDPANFTTIVIQYIPNILSALAVLVFFFVLYIITSKIFYKVLDRTRLDSSIEDLLIKRLYKFALITIAFVMAASQLGVDVAAAIAGLGIAGIAIGFAAKDTLSNIIAGFIIFIDKPFIVGDWVSVDQTYGQIREITLRTTRIQTLQNKYAVIPNQTIVDMMIINHSKNGMTRIDIPVGIAYKESIKKARGAILSGLDANKVVLKDPEPVVRVAGLGDSSVDLEVQVWIGNAGDEVVTDFRVRETIKNSLDKAGIEIPFPHLQLFVDDIKDKVFEKINK
jgi:small-conductance mechanosensitive channel